MQKSIKLSAIILLCGFLVSSEPLLAQHDTANRTEQRADDDDDDDDTGKLGLVGLLGLLGLLGLKKKDTDDRHRNPNLNR